jgi:hypothetical protein
MDEHKSKYEKGFTYFDDRGTKITLLEWVNVFNDSTNPNSILYRWKVKCEAFGIISEAWTDDCWIDVYTKKAFLNKQTNKILYYDQVDIIPKEENTYRLELIDELIEMYENPQNSNKEWKDAIIRVAREKGYGKK